MAGAHLHKIKTVNRGLAVVAGRFGVTGGGAIVTSNIEGSGFTVAAVGTGQFRVTFTNKFPELLSAVACSYDTTASDIQIIVGPWVAGSKTLDLFMWDVSNSAVANNAGSIQFQVFFRAMVEG